MCTNMNTKKVIFLLEPKEEKKKKFHYNIIHKLSLSERFMSIIINKSLTVLE